MKDRKVRVGPVDFDVRFSSDLRTLDDPRDLDGCIEYNQALITLKDKMSWQYNRATLWHEILHGIMAQAGIGEHDERQIEILAHGIMQVVRDNPWLGVMKAKDNI